MVAVNPRGTMIVWKQFANLTSGQPVCHCNYLQLVAEYEKLNAITEQPIFPTHKDVTAMSHRLREQLVTPGHHRSLGKSC